MFKLFIIIIDTIIYNKNVEDTVFFVKHSKDYINPRTNKQYIRFIKDYPCAYYKFMKYCKEDRKLNNDFRD